jgi:hypothetical protein
MDNFDLKKFLKENKALENLNPTLKALNENEMSMDKKMTKEAMKKQIKDMIVAELELDIDNPGKDDAEVANLYDPVYEGEDPEEIEYEEDTYDYSNDFYDGDSNDFGDTDEFDGYGGYDIDEAKKKDKEEEVDVEVTDTEEEMPAEEMPAEEAPAAGGGLEDIAADMKGTEADLMDNLMKAFQIAKGMGNEKLETQVGNTLKFFVSEYIGGGEG